MSGQPVSGSFGGAGPSAAGAATPVRAVAEFELKPNHFDSLENSADFTHWSVRFSSTLIDKLGTDELGQGPNYNAQKQEKILRLLISKVKEKHGFMMLQAILNSPVDLATSTRGIKAWRALQEYYLSEGAQRLDALHEKFRRSQGSNEKAVVYITDTFNTALEIRQNGSTVDDDTIKRQLFSGLHKSYGPYVAQLRAAQATKPVNASLQSIESQH